MITERDVWRKDCLDKLYATQRSIDVAVDMLARARQSRRIALEYAGKVNLLGHPDVVAFAESTRWLVEDSHAATGNHSD